MPKAADSHIDVVIPTLNAGSSLAQAIASARVGGLVRRVIVVDGGSQDETVSIAKAAGAEVIEVPPGRGGQLKAGADATDAPWLMFLHADTVLEKDWADEAYAFIMRPFSDAAVFTIDFDTDDWRARTVAWGAMQRTRILKAPYGDQGLLISREAFEEVGGYRDMPLFEDLDIVRRLVRKRGRRAVQVLKSKAVTSAEKYQRDGYGRRVLKNLVLSTRYRMGASPERLAKDYQ